MAPVQSSIKEPLTSVVPKSSQLAEIHSRPHRLKKLIGHAAFGAALLVTCPQAGAASALSFNFTFTATGALTSPTTVTGIVDGLVDNQTDQKTGLTFTITSATNTPALGCPTFRETLENPAHLREDRPVIACMDCGARQQAAWLR